MRLFFIVFFSLYFLLHLYFYLKARAAFHFGVAVGLPLALLLLLMIAAPVLVRILENKSYDVAAHLLAYIGYTWMGILLLFISSSLVVDILRGIGLLGREVLHRDSTFLALSSKQAFLIPLILAGVIAIYGYFEALAIRTEKVTISTSKIPESVERLTIAQISDVHLGLIVGKKRLTRILDKVRAANPDIFVSTGDLVDGQMNRMNGLAAMLKEMNPRYGKYAITGNHEYIAGIRQALEFTRDAGFTLLRGESTDAAGLISIAGVDDPTGRRVGNYADIQEKELLSKLPQNRFVLFLKHRPLVDDNAKGLFDLQLSGHTHKGQIFPFSIGTYFYYPLQAGFARYGKSALYVSRGSGTWGPPIRFLAPPEVTIIELVHSKE